MLIQEQNKSWAERFIYGPPLDEAEVVQMAQDLDDLEKTRKVMSDYHCDTPEELEAYLDEQSGYSYTTSQFDEVCTEREGYEREVEELKSQVEALEKALEKEAEECES